MAKVALRFGCAKQSKNLKRYLVSSIDYTSLPLSLIESAAISLSFRQSSISKKWQIAGIMQLFNEDAIVLSKNFSFFLTPKK